jgi:hypothetical protein
MTTRKEESTYSYITGQYTHMGLKRREFKKKVQFQNYKSDGAILNLAAHDPIDWPNIISIWNIYKINIILKIK